jgi:hypothetical protein
MAYRRAFSQIIPGARRSLCNKEELWKILHPLPGGTCMPPLSPLRFVLAFFHRKRIGIFLLPSDTTHAAHRCRDHEAVTAAVADSAPTPLALYSGCKAGLLAALDSTVHLPLCGFCSPAIPPVTYHFSLLSSSFLPPLFLNEKTM